MYASYTAQYIHIGNTYNTIDIHNGIPSCQCLPIRSQETEHPGLAVIAPPVVSSQVDGAPLQLFLSLVN